MNYAGSHESSELKIQEYNGNEQFNTVTITSKNSRDESTCYMYEIDAFMTIAKACGCTLSIGTEPDTGNLEYFFAWKGKTIKVAHDTNQVHTTMKQDNKIQNSKVFVELEYNDESTMSFDLIPNAESSNDYQAIIFMVTRGTLMASTAVKATAYNMDGFPIASYTK